MMASVVPSSPPDAAIEIPESPSLPSCRICHSEDADSQCLISPCSCAGSLRLVHPACLQQWITVRPQPLAGGAPSPFPPPSSSSLLCELCRSPYVISYRYVQRPLACNRSLLSCLPTACFLLLYSLLSAFLLRTLPQSLPAAVRVALVLVLAVCSLLALRSEWRKWRRENRQLVVEKQAARQQQQSADAEGGHQQSAPETSRIAAWSERLLPSASAVTLSQSQTAQTAAAG
jgi:E3 ubiquitin-protein ligase DOA10